MSQQPSSSGDSDSINQILTRWSLIFRARDQASAEGGSNARSEMVSRYFAAIIRFVSKVLHRMGRAKEADDVAQEVFVMMLEGGLKSADPSEGRFRDYLKGAIRNTLKKQLRRTDRIIGKELPVEPRELDQLIDQSFDAVNFESCIRDDHLNQAFVRLADSPVRSDQISGLLLQWRHQNRQASSLAMAEFLTSLHGTPVTPMNARQIRRRAAQKYARCLMEVIRESLPPEERMRESVMEHLTVVKLMQVLRKMRVI